MPAELSEAVHAAASEGRVKARAEGTDAAAPRARKLPRRITPQSLENAALHYLERFATSSANLRRVLLRKVARAATAHGDDPAEGATLVETLVARYVASGLLDDRAYAANKAASLQRRGTSRHGIRGRLTMKGLGRDLIEETLETMTEEGSGGDLAAACALARRRRLGPYRPPDERAARRTKDLATFARAGFGSAVAYQVLNADDPQMLDDMLQEES
jgi:regulatory protein